MTAQITISDDHGFIHLYDRSAEGLEAHLRRFLARGHAGQLTAGELAAVLISSLNEPGAHPRVFVDSGSTDADERYRLDLLSGGWQLLEPASTGAFG